MKIRLRARRVYVLFTVMSATLIPDDLRIPPMPRTIRLATPRPAPRLRTQLLLGAIAGFGSAWLLARFVIG